MRSPLFLAAGLLALAPPLNAADPPPLTGLAADIVAYESADLTADPKGKLAALMALKARVEADGKVAPKYVAMLYSAISAAHFYLQDPVTAAEWLARASDLQEKSGAPPADLAQTLSNRGAVLHALGRAPEAEALTRRALAIRSELFGPRSVEVAETAYNLATALRTQGKLEEALANLRLAAEIQAERTPDNYPKKAMRLTGLATVLNETGRSQEAIETGYRAEALTREHLGEEHQLHAVALNNLATNLNAAGRFSEALPILREAVRIRARLAGEDHFFTAYSLRNLAFALQALGQASEAEALLARAAAILEANEGPEVTALSAVHGARATIAAGRADWAAYDTHIGQAIARVDAKLPEAHPERAYTHLSRAQIVAERGRPGEALVIAERWVPLLDAALPAGHRNRIWAAALLARLRAAAGEAPERIDPLLQATLEELRGQLGDFGMTAGDIARAAESQRNAALLLFETALERHDNAAAFEALQLANISDLSLGLAMTADIDDTAALGAAAALRREVLDLARQERELARRKAALLQAKQPEAVAAIETEIATNASKAKAAEARLRAEFPGYAARYRPVPVALAALQARMTPGEVLFSPVEGLTRGWAVSVTPTGFAAPAFDAGRVRALAANLRRSVDDGGAAPFPLADAAALYRALFPTGLPEGARLSVHGGRDLAKLPLALLLSRDHAGALADAPWLARQASVAVVPSLTRFGSAAARASKGAIRVAGVGGADLPADANGPQFAALFRSGLPAAASIADLPALPNAARELSAIAAALPGDDDLLLIGADAHEEKLKAADLRSARVLAFATHGLVSGEMKGVWEPALLVGTAPGSGEDGLLGASEIARLSLDADWVILSACNTAAGGLEGAPMYSGLATAFAEAGARGLMLSHWRVRDDAAARLTVDTVKGSAAGLSRAEALRRAQLKLIKDRRTPNAAHPAIWAPFVIVQ